MIPDDESGLDGHTFRSFQLTPRSRASAIALAVAILVLGGVFVVFGLVLLVGLAAVGTVLGTGIMLYQRLTGRLPRFLRRETTARRSLDPSREIFPESPSSARPLHNDERLPPET